MKKTISIILATLLVFGIFNFTVFAAEVKTPKATASNAVGGVNVYWNAVDGAVKYSVFRRDAGSKTWNYVGITTKTNLIDTKAANGKYYAYSVRAYNESGLYSDYNASLTYSVKCVATPVLTSIKNITNGLQIKWNSVSGASYRVYRRGAGSTSWTYLGTTNSTTFTDSKATSGAYWRYTIRAVSGGYYSGFDTNGLFTIRLANPYSIKGTVKVGYVNVTWGKVNGATSYRVYKRGAGSTYWSYLGTSTTTSFVDSNVVKGQYYRYTVKAMRGNVSSDYYTNSPALKYTSHNPITAPENLVDKWIVFSLYGFVDGKRIEDVEKYAAYLNKTNYTPNGTFMLYEYDCCKTYEDYINHVKFYYDIDSEQLNEHYVEKSQTFACGGKFYTLCYGGHGGPGYQRKDVKMIDEYTCVIDAHWGFDNKKDVFTIKKINGSWRVVSLEEWVNV